MAYVDRDFKTKKEFKAAVESGKGFRPYNPSGMFEVNQNGRISIEGPHYPKPHKWYADCDIKDGVITRVR